MTAVDRAFVERWSTQYHDREMTRDSLELRLFDEVGPRVRERGYYMKRELAEVGEWKSRGRDRANIARNEEGDIRDLTCLAFQAPAHLRHRILSLLYGVQTPTASALLAVWKPDIHTVIDFRAVDSLHSLGELSEVIAYEEYEEKYPAYVATCQALAGRLGVEPRALDRALWMWDKAGSP